MRVRRLGVNAIMLTAIVIGILVGIRLYAFFAAG